MSRDERRYVRVYYDLIREFPEVYANDGALSCWLRLLMVADAMWPATSELPRSVKKRPLAMLADVGLVERVGDFQFQIRGLHAERTRRQDAARNAAALRWQSKGNAAAPADAMPRRDETRRTETSKKTPPPPAKRGRREDGTNPRSQGTAPRQNGHALRDLGESPRQVTKREKRDPTPLHVILARAAAAGHDEGSR